MAIPSQTINRINRVIDYIFTHRDQDISLQTLAGVAHYSRDHLPKLFKEVVGETPKQYGLQLRLETAFHYLVIQPGKAIREIALDNGFSSPAVFTRAVKNYFGHSPEEIRRLSHARQMKLLHGVGTTSASPPVAPTGTVAFARHPEIRIVRRETISGVYVLSPFNDPGKIREAFWELCRLCDGATTGPHFFGILTPHQRNSYRAFLPLPAPAPVELAYSGCEIKGGVYASFTVRGDLRVTNKAAHHFYRRWLPASGYRIAGIAGFETFEGNPADTPYYQLERHIHIPIEPDR